MNYYIDFDHTLYNTPKLTEKMLNSIVCSAKSQKNIDETALFAECKTMFNREHIYNIYDLVKYLAEKYSFDFSSVLNDLNNTILNSSDVVFDDAIPFLKRLKSAGHNVFMLSYQPFGGQFSIFKIAGSNLSDFFDAEYITSIPKYELDLDYSNGIFIDDSPKDLLELYNKKAKQVIRLRRKNDTYSSIELNNSNIKEYENLSDIPIV